MSPETGKETLDAFRKPTTIMLAAIELAISKEIVSRRVKELVASGALIKGKREERVAVKGVRPFLYHAA